MSLAMLKFHPVLLPSVFAARFLRPSGLVSSRFPAAAEGSIFQRPSGRAFRSIQCVPCAGKGLSPAHGVFVSTEG